VSKLAKKIAPKGTPATPRRPGAPGPRAECARLYRDHADLADWQAVQYLRETKNAAGVRRDWRAVQIEVDEMLGVTEPIAKERFRYHWLRRCDCWPPELKL
jgi:hypothetical protein